MYPGICERFKILGKPNSWEEKRSKPEVNNSSIGHHYSLPTLKNFVGIKH